MENTFIVMNESELMEIDGGALSGWALAKAGLIVAGTGVAGVVAGVGIVAGTVWVLGKLGA